MTVRTLSKDYMAMFEQPMAGGCSSARDSPATAINLHCWLNLLSYNVHNSQFRLLFRCMVAKQFLRDGVFDLHKGGCDN